MEIGEEEDSIQEALKSENYSRWNHNGGICIRTPLSFPPKRQHPAHHNKARSAVCKDKGCCEYRFMGISYLD